MPKADRGGARYYGGYPLGNYRVPHGTGKPCQCGCGREGTRGLVLLAMPDVNSNVPRAELRILWLADQCARVAQRFVDEKVSLRRFYGRRGKAVPLGA